MGMDVAFDRKAAVAAGLEFVTEARYPEDAENWPDDPDMQAFCNQIVTYIKVPFRDFMTEDSGGEEHVVVRANKWGAVYAPLTLWLTNNNIHWDEF